MFTLLVHTLRLGSEARGSEESEARKKMADEELNLPGSFGYGDLSGMSPMSQFDEGGLPNSNEEESGTVPEPTNTRVTQIPPKKRGRKAKEKEAAFPWKDELVFLLIDKWQTEAVLYNVNDKDYHDKNKRNGALKRITSAISESGTNLSPSADQILDKMNTLRTYYNTLRHKVMISLYISFYMKFLDGCPRFLTIL